jgi:hypothetical protein
MSEENDFEETCTIVFTKKFNDIYLDDLGTNFNVIGKNISGATVTKFYHGDVTSNIDIASHFALKKEVEILNRSITSCEKALHDANAVISFLYEKLMEKNNE